MHEHNQHNPLLSTPLVNDDDGDDDDDDDYDDDDDDDGSSAVGPGLQDDADFAISFCFYCFKTPLSQFSKYQFLCQEVL